MWMTDQPQKSNAGAFANTIRARRVSRSPHEHTPTRALKEHHTRAASDTARGGMRAAHPSPQPPGPEHCAAARVPERATARHTAQERASGQLPTSRLNAEQQMHRWQLKSSGPSARLGRYIYPGHIVDGRHGGGVETSTRRLVEPAGSDRNGWRCTQNGRTERSQPYLGDGAGPSPPKSARATQTVWYTLDKIPIPPECLRLPIWAYVALHITAGARMLVCVRMDSFSWPDGRPCRVAGQSQDQWHSSPRHASGSVSARQRGAPGTGSSRSCSRRAPTQRPPPAWAGGACVSASRLALPTGGRATTARPRWRVNTASGIELSDGTSPHAALGGATPAHRRSHRSLSQRRKSGSPGETWNRPEG